MHIHIQKPTGAFVANYFSYESKAHIKQLQTIVDHEKHFRNVFMGLPRSMDNLNFLPLSTIMQPTMDFLILNMDHKMAFAPTF
jgi:hypothetical protein